MKKLFALCLILTALSVPLFAQRVADNAGLLSAAEKDSLVSMLDAISGTHNFDIVIVTEENIGGADPLDYAGDFFGGGGYGQGDDRDGCIFLVVTGSRDSSISASGRGMDILTSAAYGKLESDALNHLRNDDYSGAFRVFIADWEQFLKLNAKGRRYNFFHQYNTILIIAAWLLSLAIGFIVVGIWKAGMNTALPTSQAASYIVPDSLKFGEQKDRFLYSTVTKVKRQTQSSSSVGRTRSGGKGKY